MTYCDARIECRRHGGDPAKWEQHVRKQIESMHPGEGRKADDNMA
jgi:hypothetical protein